MKKKISMLLVVIMVMMLGLNSFAAKSPTTDTTPKPDDSIEINFGNVTAPSGSVVVNGIVVQEVPDITPVQKSKLDEAQKKAEELVSSTAKVLQIVDVNVNVENFIEAVKKTVGIDLKSEDYDNMTITFSVDGVVKGQKLVLLVQKTDGTWVTITPDKVENGKVTATFNFAFKTIAFVAYNASAQTGEKVSLLPAMMIACLGAVIICGKKVRYNK